MHRRIISALALILSASALNVPPERLQQAVLNNGQINAGSKTLVPVTLGVMSRLIDAWLGSRYITQEDPI